MDPLQTTINLLSNASKEMNKPKNISALASAPAPTPAPYPAGKDIPAVQFSNLSRNDLKVGSWIKITSSRNNKEYPGVIIGINQNKNGKNIYKFAAYNAKQNKLVERNISNNMLNFEFIKPMTDEEIGEIILKYGDYDEIQKKFYEDLLNKLLNKLTEINNTNNKSKWSSNNKTEFNDYLSTINNYKNVFERNKNVTRENLTSLIKYPKYIDEFIKKMRQKISLYDIVEYKKNNKIMIGRINKIENNKIKISNNPWIVDPRQETKNINKKNIVQVLGKGENQYEIKNTIKKYITEKINGIVSYYSDDSTDYSKEIIKKVKAFLDNFDSIPPLRYTQLLDIIDVVDKKRLKLSKPKPKSGLTAIPVTTSQTVPEKPI